MLHLTLSATQPYGFYWPDVASRKSAKQIRSFLYVRVDPPYLFWGTKICVCLCVGDSSEEWQKITKSDREKIGLTFDNDGEFWSVPPPPCNVDVIHADSPRIFSAYFCYELLK